MLQLHRNTWAHKGRYNLEFHTLTEVQQFSASIVKAPDDGHISQNM
jgi:hypothetical protein